MKPTIGPVSDWNKIKTGVRANLCYTECVANISLNACMCLNFSTQVYRVGLIGSIKFWFSWWSIRIWTSGFFKVNLVKIEVYLKLNDLAKCHIYDRWPYLNVFLQLKILNSMLSLPSERSISLFWNEFPQWILTVSFYVLPVRKELRFGVRRSVFNERENLESLKSLHPVRFPFSIQSVLCNFSSVGINLIRILIQRIFLLSQKSPAGFWKKIWSV